MKIISWNIRGLGSQKKRRTVKEFLKTVNPEILSYFKKLRRKYMIEDLWAVFGMEETKSGLLFLLADLLKVL